jgi:carnitine O-acetyltransferase
MAMQLATYRLFGEQVGTYEATQVRSFLHGRTETTRSVSVASEAFIKAMGLRPKGDEGNPRILQEKITLLRNATKEHGRYAGLASQGRGVDRHFFGLVLLGKDGETAPALYSNPVFQRAKRWRASTSQLTHPRFALWGYGEVVPDGVGLAYSVLPRSCVFNITALKAQGWTDKLADLLEEALLEMGGLAEMNKLPSSKL